MNARFDNTRLSDVAPSALLPQRRRPHLRDSHAAPARGTIGGRATSRMLAAVLCFIALVATIQPAIAQQSWAVAIGENPGLTNCGGTTNIPVAGASDCNTAKASAWTLLQTLEQIPGCVNPSCPAGTVITQGPMSCSPDPFTLPNGTAAQRWQINTNWSCTPQRTISLPCCRCLGGVSSIDLSTGRSGPNVPVWKVNGGTAYVTPAYPGWSTALSPAKWLQPVAAPVPSPNVHAGTYKYAVQFNIPKCTIPMNVRLTGKFAADNSAIVKLNGNTLASCAGPNCFNGTGGGTPATAFSSGALQPGIHTLEIDVTNVGGASGLIVSAMVSGQCAKE